MECRTCRFWLPVGISGRVFPKEVSVRREEAKKGECRRYPIVPTALDVDRFPTSKADAWCGEYVKTGKSE